MRSVWPPRAGPALEQQFVGWASAVSRARAREGVRSQTVRCRRQEAPPQSSRWRGWASAVVYRARAPRGGRRVNGAATVRPRRSRRICRQTGAWSFVHRRPGSSALSPTGRVHRHPELRGRYSPRSPRNQTASRGPAALAPRAGSWARGPRWALASLGWESQDEGRYSSFVYSCSAQPGEERERITACRSTGRGDQSGVETSASPTPGSTALHLSVPSRSGRGIYRSSPKTPDALARAPAVAAPQRLLVSPRRASVRVPLTIVCLTRRKRKCPLGMEPST